MHMHPLYPYETFRKVFFGGDEKEKQSNSGDVRGDVLVFVVVGVGMLVCMCLCIYYLVRVSAPLPAPSHNETHILYIDCSPRIVLTHDIAIEHTYPTYSSSLLRISRFFSIVGLFQPILNIFTNLLQKVAPGLHIPLLPQKPTTTAPTPYAKPTSVSVSGISPISCSFTLDGIHYNDALTADIPKPGAMLERKPPPPPYIHEKQKV